MPQGVNAPDAGPDPPVEGLGEGSRAPRKLRAGRVLPAAFVLLLTGWLVWTSVTRSRHDARVEDQLATTFERVRAVLLERAEALASDAEPAVARAAQGHPLDYDPYLRDLEIYVRRLHRLEEEIALYEQFSTGSIPRGAKPAHHFRRLAIMTVGDAPEPPDEAAEASLARAVAATRPPPLELSRHREPIGRRIQDLTERYLEHSVDPTAEQLDLGPRFDTLLRRIYESTLAGPDVADRIRRSARARFEGLQSGSSRPGQRPEGIYEVQVGAFRLESHATALLDRLSERGYDGYLVELRDLAGRPIFTVRLGRFATRDEAQAAADELTAAERMPILIRHR